MIRQHVRIIDPASPQHGQRGIVRHVQGDRLTVRLGVRADYDFDASQLAPISMQGWVTWDPACKVPDPHAVDPEISIRRPLAGPCCIVVGGEPLVYDSKRYPGGVGIGRWELEQGTHRIPSA